MNFGGQIRDYILGCRIADWHKGSKVYKMGNEWCTLLVSRTLAYIYTDFREKATENSGWQG